jgi:pimeloyl-ACP methyl ester carboxylesterase
MKWGRIAEGTAVQPDNVAPPAWRRMREFAWHLPRLLAGLGPLEPRGPEDGPPVLVIPGFLAGDRTTMDLRRALGRFGWRVHPWLLGVNLGAKPNTMDLLCERLDALEDPRKVLLVGWSLGGMFARELAHRCPERVRAVASLGSPFSGDLKTNTNVREFYEWVAGHDVYAPPFEAHEGKPPVPTISFWSRKDGIVAPQAARGLEHEVDRSVEVDTHHMGLALWRPALSRIAMEIESFLTEVEGCPPVVRAGLSESRH